MLSRNFRLQKVGNLEWLRSNYNFSHISYSIDELIVVDVTRGTRNTDEFCSTLKKLAEGCFIPIAAGGGIRDLGLARLLLRSGADKVIVNSALFDGSELISDLASEFGRQSIVASIDVRLASNGEYQVWSECANKCHEDNAASWVKRVSEDEVGEIYLNSIDRDGTGLGYDFRLLDLMPANISKPVILAGGVGSPAHLAEGLMNSRVDAVATANLFNFVGDGLKQARASLISGGVDLPFWNAHLFADFFNSAREGEQI